MKMTVVLKHLPLFKKQGFILENKNLRIFHIFQRKIYDFLSKFKKAAIFPYDVY